MSFCLLLIFIFAFVGEVSALSRSFNERQRRVNSENLTPNDLDIFVKRLGVTTSAVIICIIEILI